MTTIKRKKFTRQRGGFTHGWGSKKKHRGAGSRGGKGMAGTGKRADQRKPQIWKNKKYFGKHGFISRKVKVHSINLDDFLMLINKGHIKDEKGVYDLSKLKIGKLLGRGTIKDKIQIKVAAASKRALDKVNGAGGALLLEKKEKENGPVQYNTK